MIINIRGTSGSGKTTLVRRIMERFGPAEVDRKEGVKKAQGYFLRKDLYILGSYETDCGGCDTIKTQDEIQQRVLDRHAADHSVLFEGLLVCNSYGRWKQVAEQPGMDFRFVFLSTPKEECIQAVLDRRIARGNTKPADERMIYNLTRMYDTNVKTLGKCRADGLSAYSLGREEAFEEISSWFM